jgi:hypothetical protein
MITWNDRRLVTRCPIRSSTEGMSETKAMYEFRGSIKGGKMRVLRALSCWLRFFWSCPRFSSGLHGLGGGRQFLRAAFEE